MAGEAGVVYAEKVNLISEITTELPKMLYVESGDSVPNQSTTGDGYIKKIAISDLVYTRDETYSKSETNTKLNAKQNIIKPIKITDVTGGNPTPRTITYDGNKPLTISPGSNISLNGGCLSNSNEEFFTISVKDHNHAADNITSGILAIARIPTGTTNTTVALGNHTHVAGDITSGTLAIARIPTGTTSTTVALGNHTHSVSGIKIHSVGAGGEWQTDASSVTLTCNVGEAMIIYLYSGKSVTIGSNSSQRYVVFASNTTQGINYNTVINNQSFTAAGGVNGNATIIAARFA